MRGGNHAGKLLNIMEEEGVEADAAKAAALVRDKLLSKSNDGDWENMSSSVEGEGGRGLT